MIFTDLVDEVMTRLNYTSNDAETRVGKRINDRHRRVTSSIGLVTSRRVVKDVTRTPASSPELPDVIIDGMEKVSRITSTEDSGAIRLLTQETFDDISNIQTATRIPHAWALKRMTAGQVIITLDAFPETDPFTITVEGYDISTDLAGDAEPLFPSDFHDILVAGAMADELFKMEKPALAKEQEMKYETRLSDLRMFIAKSAYLDILQNKRTPNIFFPLRQTNGYFSN